MLLLKQLFLSEFLLICHNNCSSYIYVLVIFISTEKLIMTGVGSFRSFFFLCFFCDNKYNSSKVDLGFVLFNGICSLL